MAEDISTLVVKVTSDGITDRAKELDNLTAAAGRAEESTKKLGTSVVDSSQASAKASGVAQALTESVNNSTSATNSATEALKRKAIEQKREIELFNGRGAAYAQAQAEAIKMNAQMDREAAATRAAIELAERKAVKEREQIQLLAEKAQRLEASRAAQQAAKDLELAQAQAIAQKLTMQRQDIELYKERTRAYLEAQAAEARASRAATRDTQAADARATADALRQKALEQKRDIDLHNLQAKAYAQTHAEALRINRALDANTRGHGGNSAVIRENLVLLHELSQGSYKRFGGSLLVLAEYSNFFPRLIATIGAAATALGVVFGGALALVGVGLVSGALELKAFEKSLILTGNIAGLTRDSLNEMSHTLSDEITGGATHAKVVLEELAATGKFSGETLEAVGKAALNFEYLTGESSEKVVKMFDGMEHGVAKWAEKANESYHFLTYEQYEHIKALEIQGDKQGAMVEAANAMSAAFDTHGRKVGALVQWYREWATAIDRIKGFFKSVGAGDTDKEKLTKQINTASMLQDQIEKAKAETVFFSGDEKVKEAKIKRLQDSLKTEKELIKASQKTIADEISAAQRKAEAAELTAQAIAADAQVETRQKRNRTRQEKLLDEIALESSARTRQNAGLLQSQLAAQGLSYTELVADAKAKDSQVVAQIKQSGAVRMNAQENEFKAQVELAKKYGLKLKTDEEQKAKVMAAIQDEFKEKKPRGVDDSAITRDTEVLAVKTKNKLLTEEYESFIQLSKERANKEGANQREELQARDTATKEYLGKLQTNLAEELAILDKFQGKTNVSIAANNKKKQELRDEFKITSARLDKVTKKDEEDVAAKEYQAQVKLMKQIEQTGLAEQKRLEAELLADTQRAESIGQLKSVALGAAAEKYRAELLDQEQKNQTYRLILQIGEADGIFNEGQVAAAKRQLEFGEKNLTLIEKIIAAKGEQVKAQLKVEEQDRTTKNLDDALSAAKRFEKGLVDSFGKIGKAIGGVAVAFLQSEKDRDLAVVKRSKAAKDQESQLKAQREYEDEIAQASINGYANMATAAAGFFKEGSNGYKTLTGVSQIFHAIEVAQAGQRLATLAIEAVLTQAKGDPFTAFGRMAAMAAIVASLGYAVGGGFSGGGKGGATAAEVQKTQNTGTVFGDATAKADSAQKSVELLKQNSTLLLPLTSAMLKSLQSIEASVAGLGNLILRTDGLQQGTNLGIKEGTISNAPSKLATTAISSTIGLVTGITGAITGLATGGLSLLLGAALNTIVGKVLGGLFGSTTQKIVDSGIGISGNVGDLKKGVGYNQYASIDTTKSSFFGLSKSTSNRVETQGLNSELSSQFALIFTNLEDTLKTAATSLGKSGEAVGAAINGVVIDSKVSLKDLKGNELTAALNGLISKASDQIAEAAFPGLDAFRQVGEGYAQTVIRVASSIEQAKVSLREFGITAISYTEVTKKTGDVTREIIAQSIALKEGSSGVGKIIDMVSGSASDLITAYRELTAARKAMQDTGLGSNLSLDTITGAGGLKELTAGLSKFSESYFTAEEKLKVQTNDVTASFTALGKTLPESRDQLRGWIEAASSVGDQTMVGKLLVLTEAYDKLAQATGATSATGVLSNVTALAQGFDALGTALPSSLEQLNALVDVAQAAGDGERLTTLKSLREAYKQLGQTSPDVGELTKSFEALGKTLPSSVTQIDTWIASAKAVGDVMLASSLSDLEKVFVKLTEGVKSALTVFNQAIGAVDLAFKQLQDSVAAEKTAVDKAFAVSQKKLNDEFVANQKALAAQNKANTDKIVAEKATNLQLEVQRRAALVARIAMAQVENKEESARNKKAMESVTNIIRSIQTIIGSVQSAIKATEASVSGEMARSRALSTVKSAGLSSDVTAFAGLEDAIKELSTPREDLFSSFLDFQRSQAEANEALRSLEGASLGQVSDAEKQLEALKQIQVGIDNEAKYLADGIAQSASGTNSQVEAEAKKAQDAEDARFKAAQDLLKTNHDAELEALSTRHTEQIDRLDQALVLAQSQVDAVKGVDNSVKSLQAAILSFSGAVNFASSVAPAAGKSLTPTASATVANTLTVKATQALDTFPASFGPDGKVVLRSFAVGTNELPADMLAQVHKGERIIPAADNAELMRRLKTNDEGDVKTSNKALLDKIDELIQVVMTGDVANVQKTNDLYRIVRDWEGSGLPATRAE